MNVKHQQQLKVTMFQETNDIQTVKQPVIFILCVLLIFVKTFLSRDKMKKSTKQRKATTVKWEISFSAQNSMILNCFIQIYYPKQFMRWPYLFHYMFWKSTTVTFCLRFRWSKENCLAQYNCSHHFSFMRVGTFYWNDIGNCYFSISVCRLLCNLSRNRNWNL